MSFGYTLNKFRKIGKKKYDEWTKSFNHNVLQKQEL
jgi:hypothetical protein